MKDNIGINTFLTIQEMMIYVMIMTRFGDDSVAAIAWELNEQIHDTMV